MKSQTHLGTSTVHIYKQSELDWNCTLLISLPSGARHFEQQRDSSRRLDSANGKRLLFALLKQHTHQGCVVPVHIGRRNRPAGLFCVVLVTFGRGSLPFARQSSPAIRPSNNFADTKTPKTSAMELNRRMYTCFSSLLLAFVSLVRFLCFRYSSRLQSS